MIECQFSSAGVIAKLDPTSFEITFSHLTTLRPILGGMSKIFTGRGLFKDQGGVKISALEKLIFEPELE